ncbi:GIY-YIG nuclease family protein [Streptococcus sp.]|uniref:GIY-YIG nuclease family protein n=1 Tax=Streptococcus sp. TaxID=1306 RepID=UPI0035A198F3
MLNILSCLEIDDRDASDYNIKINKNIDNYPVLEWYLNREEEKFKSYIFTRKSSQSKRAHFTNDRKYLIQLIEYSKDNWLFVGVFKGDKLIASPIDKDIEIYDLEHVKKYSYLEGRAIFGFKRPQGPTSSRYRADDYYEKFELVEILPDKLQTAFPGYDKINLSFEALSGIITKNNLVWKTALSNLKGVYLQVDRKTGKKYVGSAYGKDMIWKRFSDYVKTCHGGNKDLKELFENEGEQYFKDNFHYSLLETFKSSVDDDIIIQREHYWMTILDSKKHGYNN